MSQRDKEGVGWKEGKLDGLPPPRHARQGKNKKKHFPQHLYERYSNSPRQPLFAWSLQKPKEGGKKVALTAEPTNLPSFSVKDLKLSLKHDTMVKVGWFLFCSMLIVAAIGDGNQ